MKNWKVFLLSVAMATSFVTDVHCAKSTNKETKAKSGSNKVKNVWNKGSNKVKIGWNKIKNKFSNKDAMDSKDAKVLKNAVSTMSELGSIIPGMQKFAKLVKNVTKQAGKQDESFKNNIEDVAKIVTENINSRGAKLRSASGTLKSIINDLYKSIGKAVETVAGLMQTYDVDEDDKDAAKKKVIYGKLIAIHKGLKQIYEAMKNQIEPEAASDENDQTEQDDSDDDEAE